ncbi:ABC transporter permease [Sulfidibacter corallicola]|uniref:ABC transporter permease n=1 Tax=Sulfidibacter corallicola TaxID=2818388 RepID=A0A8A4TN12_SULCO|nr:ABC transporter permease [Sulfidibacter corallicola]QTD50943.1 ABC transporter permease [Sulfidibacter corallicola]
MKHHDLQIAIQSLRRRPGFVMTVMLTLGLTLGAVISVFNLNVVLMMKPLPYPAPDRIFITDHYYQSPQGRTDSGFSTLPGLLESYRTQQVFQSYSIMSLDAVRFLDQKTEPKISALFTTPEYFEILGTSMTLGRPFEASERLDTHHPVVILSHSFWKTRLEGARDVLNRSIQLGDVHYRVIGVTSKDFRAPDEPGEIDVWLPWDFHGFNAMQLENWGNTKRTIMGLGRLSPAVSEREASDRLSHLLDRTYQSKLSPELRRLDRQFKVNLVPLETRMLGDSKQRALLLFGAVFMLLLIASSNVVNLFCSRAAEKQRTLAIQAALGAKPVDLFRALFAESLILCIASSLLGLLVAAWCFELIRMLASAHFARLDELSLDIPTLCFSMALCVTLAAVFSLFAVKLIRYEDLRIQLQASGKGSGMQISKFTRNALVTCQVAVTGVLLSGAFALLQQSLSVISQPLGFESHNLVSVRLDAKEGMIGSDEIDHRRRIMADYAQALRAMPQVAQCSFSFTSPIRTGMSTRYSDVDNREYGDFPINFVDQRYHEVVGIELLRGQWFTSDHIRNDDPVVVLSESAAKHIEPEGRVLGTLIYDGSGVPKKVIGIVKDIAVPGRAEEIRSRDAYLTYVPWNMHLLIRLKQGGNTNHLIRQTLADVDPSRRVAEIVHVDEQHRRIIARDQVNAGVASGLTLLALLLAGAGMFGVFHYGNLMRRFEFGVHMCLGAQTHQIAKLVARSHFQPVLLGLAISVTAVLFLRSWFDQAADAWFHQTASSLFMTVPALLITAFFANYFPLRKLFKSNPVQALRNE